jgi:hypothetical protein
VVGWVVSPWCGRCGCGPVQGFLFEHEVCLEVDPGGGHVDVAEPERDDGGVDSGVEQSHGRGVAEHVWCDLLAGQRGAGRCRCSGVNSDPLGESVQAQRTTAVAGKQWIARVCGAFGHPGAQDGDGADREWCDAVFASFAVLCRVADYAGRGSGGARLSSSGGVRRGARLGIILAC